MWVSCHGEHGAFEPERSMLTLSGQHVLTLEQMLELRTPRAEGRRLLVLNACDSGTAAQFGGIWEFGIGAVLAGPTQAVVGHQWSIGFVEAAGFGAVLAAALATGATYLEAVDAAAVALERGIGGIFDRLASEPIDGELLARLEIARERSGDLLDWGSPTFLE
jgi:CHAT domain